MFDPVTIGIGLLIWKAFNTQAGKDFGTLTPVRKEVYNNAMEYAPPDKLRLLADDFQKEGLKAEAHWMRVRADWRSRPPEVKRKHDEVFAKALQSDKVEGILDVAKIFENMTATIKAAQLRARATSLTEARAAAVAPPPAPEPVPPTEVAGPAPVVEPTVPAQTFETIAAPTEVLTNEGWQDLTHDGRTPAENGMSRHTDVSVKKEDSDARPPT